MTAVVVVIEAEDQLREIDEWWSTNRRDASTLVVDEFERCMTLLESSPDIGTGFRRTTIPGVRRLIMKTRHVVYYVHDTDHAIVYVIAVWGGPKGRHPILRDPR
jgi:plasmid stabilization system protein ParE